MGKAYSFYSETSFNFRVIKTKICYGLYFNAGKLPGRNGDFNPVISNIIKDLFSMGIKSTSNQHKNLDLIRQEKCLDFGIQKSISISNPMGEIHPHSVFQTRTRLTTHRKSSKSFLSNHQSLQTRNISLLLNRK